MKPPIITETVEHDFCIGCGLCAAICPDSVLEIRFNRFGEYNPGDLKDCVKECGLCLKVCPFADGIPDEDEIGRLLFDEISGIKHLPETGYVLEAFVGYSKIDEHRQRGSSGGMATWLLQTLLEGGAVDAVVCVTSNPDPAKLFQFAVFTTAEEVRAASGSAYYPVELSGVLRYIIEHPARYAVTGLPCFVKAIRLAQLRNRNLRERIVVVLGLTCGQLKSKHYTAYLAALAELEGAPNCVRYRGKDPEQPASNYYFSCWDRDGEERRLHRKDGVSEAWVNRWFTPIACNYCDDVFAECADVTFMDAWLSEYMSDSRGTNLVLVRTPNVLKSVCDGIEYGVLEARQIPIEDVIRSQASVVAVKRDQLANRLHRESSQGKKIPKKRVMMRPIANPLLKREIYLMEKMQQASRELSVRVPGIDVIDSGALKAELNKYLIRIRLVRLASACINLPLDGFDYVRRSLNGR